MFPAKHKHFFSLNSCLGGSDNFKHLNEIDLFNNIDPNVSILSTLLTVFSVLYPEKCLPFWRLLPALWANSSLGPKSTLKLGSAKASLGGIFQDKEVDSLRQMSLIEAVPGEVSDDCTNRYLLFFRNQSIKEQTDLSCVVYEKENLVRHGQG